MDDVGVGGADREDGLVAIPEEGDPEVVEEVVDADVMGEEGVAEDSAGPVLDAPAVVLGGGVNPPYVHAPSVPKSTYNMGRVVSTVRLLITEIQAGITPQLERSTPLARQAKGCCATAPSVCATTSTRQRRSTRLTV